MLFLSLYGQNDEIQREKIKIVIRKNESISSFLQRAVKLGTDIINDKWKLMGGYRIQSVDYSKDDFLFDVDTSGFLLGATYRF